MIASFDYFLRARTGMGLSIRAHEWLGPTEIARKLANELGLPVTARARIDAPEAPIGSWDGNNDEGESRRYTDDLDRFLDQHWDRTVN